MIELNEAGTRGYFARPGSGNGPGVLVLHAWWGLNSAIKQMCEGLAQEGFVALAPDLYGSAEPATTVEEAQQRVDALDRERANRAVLDGLNLLSRESDGPVAAIGFSLGASFALSAADQRPEQVVAAVCFYGTGEVNGGRAAVLGHFVAGDPWESDEYVAEVEQALRGAGRPVTFHRYEGVGHWFAEPDRPEFDAAAAELAWQRTLEFLRRELGA